MMQPLSLHCRGLKWGIFLYSQTFEKRSSLAPNPPAGLAPPAVVVVLVVGALLVQPPNSSSADTLGATENPPEAPGTIGWLAKEVLPGLAKDVLPELPQPKSFTGAGAGGGAVLVTAGLCCLVASGVDHALPQTSAPDRPLDPKEPREPIGFEAAAGVTAGAAGLERLKTEEDEMVDVGAMAA